MNLYGSGTTNYSPLTSKHVLHDMPDDGFIVVHYLDKNRFSLAKLEFSAVVSESSMGIVPVFSKGEVLRYQFQITWHGQYLATLKPGDIVL